MQQSGSRAAPQAWNRSPLFFAARMRSAQPLRVGVGVEAIVECGGVEPASAWNLADGWESRLMRVAMVYAGGSSLSALEDEMIEGLSPLEERARHKGADARAGARCVLTSARERDQ
jgi:hypothetical protein